MKTSFLSIITVLALAVFVPVGQAEIYPDEDSGKPLTTEFQPLPDPPLETAPKPDVKLPEKEASEPTTMASGETVEGEENLPRTASPLPLLLIAGMTSLAGAIGSRLLRRRVH